MMVHLRPRLETPKMLKSPFTTPEHSVLFTHDFTDYLLDQTLNVLYALFIDPGFFFQMLTPYSLHQTSHFTTLYTSEHCYTPSLKT